MAAESTRHRPDQTRHRQAGWAACNSSSESLRSGLRAHQLRPELGTCRKRHVPLLWRAVALPQSEAGGARRELTSGTLAKDKVLERVERMLKPSGRRLYPSSPWVDTRFPVSTTAEG